MMLEILHLLGSVLFLAMLMLAGVGLRQTMTAMRPLGVREVGVPCYGAEDSTGAPPKAAT